MTDYSKMSDAELMGLVKPAASDYSKMSDAELLQLVQSKAQPQGFVANATDFAKSIPGGIVRGAKGALDFITQEGTDYADKGFDPLKAPIERGVTAANNALPRPEGRAGRVGEAIGEGLGNPLSWVGPGGVALKTGAAILGSAGSEVAGQAAEGTPYEIPARLAGGLAGGVVAAKALAPAAQKAAVPTATELKAAATKGYDNATASGLELHPQGVANFASKVEQDLVNTHAHTGGQYGTAPKTLDVLESLQNPPAGATITAANLSTVRKNLGRIAGETKDFRPTPDAQAATVALEHLKDYVENIPASHVLAGDAAAYNSAIKQANADYAALSRSRTIDAKLTRAENNAQGGIATSPDNQIKSQLRTILNNPKAQRGFSAEELDAMKGVNKGTITSNILRQLGRGGSGVIPLAMHAAAAAPAAVATGGTSLVLQAMLGAGLYGAKKTAEGMTKRAADRLDEMVRMRSPEYQSRAARVPAYDPSPARAAIVRALLASNQ